MSFATCLSPVYNRISILSIDLLRRTLRGTELYSRSPWPPLAKVLTRSGATTYYFVRDPKDQLSIGNSGDSDGIPPFCSGIDAVAGGALLEPVVSLPVLLCGCCGSTARRRGRGNRSGLLAAAGPGGRCGPSCRSCSPRRCRRRRSRRRSA